MKGMIPIDNWTEGLHYEGGVAIERLAIRTPIWHGKRVGIAVFRANRSNIVEIKVLYRIKEGKPLIPKVLTIQSNRVLEYQRQVVSGTEVCLVPIADLQEKKP